MHPLSFRTPFRIPARGVETPVDSRRKRAPAISLFRQPWQSVRGLVEVQQPNSLTMAGAIMGQTGLPESDQIQRDARGLPTLPTEGEFGLCISHAEGRWMLAPSNGAGSYQHRY